MRLQWLLDVEEVLLRLSGIRRRTMRLPDGGEVSLLEGGRRRQGPPLILVHGLGTSSLSWYKVLRRLSRRHRVLAPDLPGFGRSPAPRGSEFATITQLADAIAAVVEGAELGEPAVLVGQSLGGWVCTKVAIRVPRRLAQLVLVNSAGVLYAGIEKLRTTVTPTTREGVEAFWKLMWYRVPRYYGWFWRDAALHMSMPAVHKLLDGLVEADFINRDLPRVQVPVSILWGRADRLFPADTVGHLVAALGSTRVHWIERCGHIPALERPREFVRLLHALATAPSEALPAPPAT